MIPTWAIRAGARPQEAGGHVARCALLAHALAADTAVTLVLDDDAPASLRNRAAAAAPVTTPVAALQRRWDGAVLDGYILPPAEWRAWRRQARVLAALCDGPVAETPLEAGAADLVVAPWAGATRAGDRALTGLGHALVDPRFAALPERAVPATVGRVLVTFGMRDSKNATGMALRALAALRDGGFAPYLDVTLGATAPHAGDVRVALAPFGGDATLHVDSLEMHRLLSSADLAIGGGGVSLLERLAAGVPSLTVPLAPGQDAAVAMVAAHGGTQATQRPEDLTPAALAAAVAALADDRARRAAMAAAGRRLVDGGAAGRVAAALLALAGETRHHPAGAA